MSRLMGPVWAFVVIRRAIPIKQRVCISAHIVLLWLGMIVPASAQLGPTPGIPSSSLGQANGPVQADATGMVPLATLPAAIAVPPAATPNAPSLFADFTTRTYAASIAGRLYPQPMEGILWGAGPPAGGYYIDPTATGRAAVPGTPRFTFSPAANARTGLLIEPAATNLVPDPVAYSSGWSGGADTQGKLNTDLPALFPGVGIIKHLRDSNPTANTGGWSALPLPAVAQAYTTGYWAYIPAGSTATAVCLSGSNASGITGVGTSSACANLDIKGTWQFVTTLFGTISSGTSMALILTVTGPAGAVAYTTGYSVTAGRLPLSFTSTPRAAPDALVASGTGLESTASGTLLLRGFSVAGSNAANDPSGGVQLTDGTAANAVTIQVLGSTTNPALQATVVSGGTTTLTQAGGVVQPGGFYTAAISWGGGVISYADSLGGAVSVTAAAPTGLAKLVAMPGVNPIARLAFYPVAMTPAALQTLVGSGLSVTASANASAPGATVPANFIGTSWEMNDSLFNHQWQAGAGATSLAALLNRLGPGVLRIGGDSSDGTYVPTSDRITELTSFMATVPHWGLTFGLNLCANTPSAQATIGQEVIAGVPGALIQFGNEPDLYPTTCSRAGNNYGPSNYLTDWGTYLTALQAVAPTAKLAGPDIAATDSWLAPFLAAEGSTVSELTRHFYPVCPNTSPSDTIPLLLMSDRLYAKTLAPADVAMATALSLPIRMTETNSVCAGGRTGVSNVLASATWATGYMMQLIAAGYAGVDFHSGRVATLFYTPFVQNGDLTYTPQPLYYALLLVAQIEGMRVLPVTSSVPFTTMPVQAYLDGAGATWFLAVNKNLTQSAALTISQGGSWTQQSMLTLTGASAAAATATLGGASVDNAGNWSPTRTTVARGTPVSIPPASAVLVKLQ